MLIHNAAQKLVELNITLPVPAQPVANYVATAIMGHSLIVSGQLPLENGTIPFTGKLGATVTLEEGIYAARLCMINIIAQAQAALGSLERIHRLVRLGGFVASTPDFTEQARIINGASDLAVEIFGEAGRHARAAVGVSVLPLDAPVEIEALFELTP